MAVHLGHDVSQELRGYHGRWSRTAAAKEALGRMSQEATEARATKHYNYEEAKRTIEGMSTGSRKWMNDVAVAKHDKGIHVGFQKVAGGRDSKYYQSSAHAARAIIEGHHHNENDPREGELPGHGAGFEEHPTGYHIHIVLKKGYELPSWHQKNHDTLEGAQEEVRKIREWGGTGSDSPIKVLAIREGHKFPAPRPQPHPPGRPVPPRPEVPKEHVPGPFELDIMEHPRSKGNYIVLVGPMKKNIGSVREYNGMFQAWEGGDYRGAYVTKEKAAGILLALHKEKTYAGEIGYSDIIDRINRSGHFGDFKVVNGMQFRKLDNGQIEVDIAGVRRRYDTVEEAAQALNNKEHLPEKPTAEGMPRLSDDEIFRRNIPQVKGPYEGKPPVISVRGQAVTQAQLKDARVDVMSAKSMTSRYNGQLDAPVVITKAPHGHRASPGKGTTFGAYGASKTSRYRTALELHSGMWTRSDADAVFMREKESGWWVPTDGDITMGQGVASHEYGHGVHDEMVRAGVMSQPRSNNMADATRLATDPREQEFWKQFAAAVGVPPPKETLAYTGSGRGLNVGVWFRDNQRTIKKAVSTYGGKTVTEMFAELWCEYCNNSNARPPAVIYGNYVRAMIGDMKGARKAA